MLLALYFVNTNVPNERIQLLLPQKGRSKLPEYNPNIFQRPNIDCYMEKGSAFCNR